MHGGVVSWKPLSAPLHHENVCGQIGYLRHGLAVALCAAQAFILLWEYTATACLPSFEIRVACFVANSCSFALD